MTFEELITTLGKLQAGSGKLDLEIAKLVGYQATPGPSSEDHPSSIIWLAPGTQAPTRIPRFTSSVDDAMNLAEMLAPKHVGGVTYGHGEPSAAAVNDTRAEGCSPAVALCIAAFNEYRKMKINPGA